MKHAILLLALAIVVAQTAHAQITDFTGYKFCIDPGHGGHNPANDRYVVPETGTEFWESESNFQKALRLDTLLTARGAWVILTRYTNDYPSDDEPSLTARWTLANTNNVNWFHSIHSNATGWATNTTVNYTLMLVKEDIATRQPAFPEAVTMSNTIGPSIQSKIRNQVRSTWTYLDYTFYGGPSGGFNLGVLKGLVMPGELSEGSFHDYFPETRRLMNHKYCKMEAYAIRNAFMQYFEVPADTLGIIAGIQSDVVTTNPVNFTQVRLLPVNRVVTGDSYNNGFYMFDGLAAGTYTVRFETPGYVADSVQVTLGTGATLFADRTLTSQANPAVVLASPVNNDTTVLVTSPVALTFSKPMDTASVRTAFSITPSMPGKLQWTNSNGTLTFTPSVYFTPWVTYQVRIDTMARSASGQAFDGNGDGIAGDPYVLTFTTKYVDIFPPAVAYTSPDTISGAPVPTPVVNITFDEPLNQTTVNTSNLLIQEIGGSLQYKTLEYAEENGRGAVTMHMPNGLKAGYSYRVRVSRVADLLGNTIPVAASLLWDFPIAAGTYTNALIDSVEPGTTGFVAPLDPADQAGLDSLVVGTSSARKVGIVTGNAGSLSVRCVWDPGVTSWGVRIPLDTASSGGRVRFQKTGTLLRAYIYGDGGESQVRFLIADSVEAFPVRTPDHIEASRWLPIDWVGWRALHWDLEADSLGTGTGNGLLEGMLRLDGVEFRYVPGTSLTTMQVYLDQIEQIERIPVSVKENPSSVPGTFALHPAYPNPFNASTSIGYSVGELGSRQQAIGDRVVKLVVYDLLGREVAVLVDEPKAPGSYQAQWNAAGFSSGVYVVRLMVSGAAGTTQFVASEKVVLMK